MEKHKIIAICNQKGGTGKTNVTMNLGIGLAREGKKVLLVDGDPQGDLTTSLGWRNADALTGTLADLIRVQLSDAEPVIPKAILTHDEGVDLIPSNLELSALEMSLVTAMSREYALKGVLTPLNKQYDYILIDTMPSLGMLTINALAAADSVIIPVQAQYLSAKGMTQLVKTIGRVKRQINPDLKVDGVVITMADSRTNMTKTVEETLRTQYGGLLKIYKSIIPMAIKAAETSVAAQSIYTYDKGSKAAEAYTKLTKEVLTHGEKQKAKHRAAPGR